jgi:ribosomal-protein-alanine N-acetyltransferase
MPARAVWSQTNLKKEGEDSTNAQGVRIDQMTLADVAAVHLIEKECFSSPWPSFTFGAAALDPLIDALVARSEGRIIGYLVASLNGPEYLIANVAVIPSQRRQGLAVAMLRLALDKATYRGAAYAVLDVRESNDAAITLYRQLGFRPAGKKPHYYESPREDSLMMRKELGGN